MIHPLQPRSRCSNLGWISAAIASAMPPNSSSQNSGESLSGLGDWCELEVFMGADRQARLERFYPY